MRQETQEDERSCLYKRQVVFTSIAMCSLEHHAQKLVVPCFVGDCKNANALATLIIPSWQVL